MNQTRKHRSAAQWQSILNDFQVSGLSAPKFCEQNAISYASFAKWRHKLSASTRSGMDHNSGHLRCYGQAEPLDYLTVDTRNLAEVIKPMRKTCGW
jgi:hypothetical protein